MDPEPSPQRRGWVLAAAVAATVLVFGYLVFRSGSAPPGEASGAEPPPLTAPGPSRYVPPATTTTQFVPTADLVAHYPLDGSAADAGGGGFDGVVVGAVPTEDRLGRPGGAYRFDGRSAHIAVPLPAARLGEAMTLAAWVQFDGTPQNALAWRSVTSFGTGGHVLGLDGTGAPAAGIQDDGCRFSGPTGAGDGDWHHLAVTRDAGGAVRVYLDGRGQLLTNEQPGRGGVQMAALVQPCRVEPQLEDGELWIGAAPGIGQHYAGAIDEVRIYDRAVPAAGIRFLAEQ